VDSFPILRPATNTNSLEGENMTQEKTPFEDLISGEETTAEQILAELMKKDKKRFHTEIHNPFTISTLDVLADHLKEIGGDKLLKCWLGHFRTNMVAYKRQRANEIVEAFKLKKALEERKTREQQLVGT
jgi:hypothetical protein